MEIEKIGQAELIKKIADETTVSQNVVKLILLNAAKQTVKHANNGYAVSYPGLGTFAPKDRAAKTGRNPKTGESIEIPAKRVLGFKPSSKVDLSAE